MDSLSRSIIQIAFATCIAVALLCTSYLIVSLVGNAAKADANASLAAIASLIGGASVLFSFFLSRKKTIEEGHRERKIELYSKFLLHIFTGIKKQEFKDLKLETNVELITWASQDVIGQINLINDEMQNSNADNAKQWMLLGILINKIRIDLGHKKGSWQEYVKFLVKRDDVGTGVIQEIYSKDS